MKQYELGEFKYQLIKEVGEAFDFETVKEKVTDFFAVYDYIVGDWAYGKLRLKGFNNKGSKTFNKINDYAHIDKYILENCAYGCRYFILEKIKD